MADNPFAVPKGAGRVRRNVEDAVDAATGTTPSAASSGDDTASPVKFSKGQQPSAADKAKSNKGLIDAMRKRGDIASADKDDDTSDA